MAVNLNNKRSEHSIVVEVVKNIQLHQIQGWKILLHLQHGHTAMATFSLKSLQVPFNKITTGTVQ